MPYEGEFAHYRPLQRLVESERVRSLLSRARVKEYSGRVDSDLARLDSTALPLSKWQPDWVLAIDGSHHEERVVNGFPGAEVSYITVASVMLDMAKVRQLDRRRPSDPLEFRKTEKPESIDSAFPGCNVVLDDELSATSSLRKVLFEVMDTSRVFPDCESLLDTYEALLVYKPSQEQERQKCPYGADCGHAQRPFTRSTSCYACQCSLHRKLYSTDALRIHEGMNPAGTNGAMFAEVMQTLERLWIIHILRSLEQKKWLSVLDRLAIVIDGPLAVFGHPAWLTHAINRELSRLNEIARAYTTGQDLLLLGIEKSGFFVNHFQELDTTQRGSTNSLPPQTLLLPTDSYIKRNIIFSESKKPYGEDTYFGRKFFYKTSSGALIVASLPFLRDEHLDLDSTDPACFPRLNDSVAVLDTLVSSRYPNSLAPLVSAHAEAAIPLNLGKKILADIAQKLVKQRT